VCFCRFKVVGFLVALFAVQLIKQLIKQSAIEGILSQAVHFLERYRVTGLHGSFQGQVFNEYIKLLWACPYESTQA